MGLRDDKKRETRTAILEGALARFRQEGFDATRVRDITAELRISEATFFNYFPTKQAVLEEAAEELLQRSIGRLQAEVHSDVPVPDRLEGMMAEFVADFAGDRELAALLGAHTTFFAGNRSERLTYARGLVTELFTEGQARGEVRADVSAQTLSQLFIELVLAMIRTWVDDPDDERPLGERLKLTLSILLWGCVTAQAPPAASLPSASSTSASSGDAVGP
jgi:AcrR family transcriptional regulator